MGRGPLRKLAEQLALAEHQAERTAEEIAERLVARTVDEAVVLEERPYHFAEVSEPFEYHYKTVRRLLRVAYAKGEGRMALFSLRAGAPNFRVHIRCDGKTEYHNSFAGFQTATEARPDITALDIQSGTYRYWLVLAPVPFEEGFLAMLTVEDPVTFEEIVCKIVLRKKVYD